MRPLIFALSFITSSISFGQTIQYQNLLDTALSGHGALIICSRPIKKVRLDSTEMQDYFYFHHDYTNKSLDTLMFAQIVKNSKSVDTTLWQDKELKNYLMVNNRDEEVSIKYATQKLELTEKKKINFYKKQINNYNITDSNDRDLYYFSRPVFDNSKKFAIVQWDNGHSGLGGGGGIVLYQLQNDSWKEVGIINNWKY